MGINIIGMNAQSGKGREFSSTIKGWEILWGYCVLVAPTVISNKLAVDCNYNSNVEVEESVAIRLAAMLEVMLENGSTEKFGNLWNERLESIDPMLTKRYPFGKVRVEEFSEFLKECGGFRVT